MNQLDRMIHSVEKIMTKSLGETICLKGTIISEPERRNLLLRCTVLDGPNSALDTVIVKQSLNDRGYDWAGCQFLSNISSKICPRFYGGDLKGV